MRTKTIICLVLALAAASLAATHEGCARGGAAGGLGAKHKHPRFSITGHVAGLLPRAHRKLRLKVHNWHRFKIRVTSIKTRVGNASATCRASNLSVRRFRGHKKVRGRHSRRIRIRIAMAASAPNACQGASFPLTYKGRAVRRGRALRR
jgi:hypothetical protein